MQIDDSKVQQGFDEAACSDLGTAIVSRCKSEPTARVANKVTMEEVEDEYWQIERSHLKAESLLLHHVDDAIKPALAITPERPQPNKHPTRPASIEEIEDKSMEAHRIKPKSQCHLLIGIDEVDDTCDDPEEPSQDQDTSAEKSDCKHALHSEMSANGEATAEAHTSNTTLPPPSNEKPFYLRKKRFTPAGTSALGVSVLSMKGWVSNLENGVVDLRLNSCADVTLISEDFFQSLKGAPKVMQGMRMQLWQLTDKDSSLKGFVRIPITMQSEEGILLQSEVEAYIVLGMTVPILLGKDYQLNYEVGVMRNVETGTWIHFTGTDFKILAHRVEHTMDFNRMRQSELLAGHFI